jgi:DNA-binding response OmpR family regulator
MREIQILVVEDDPTVGVALDRYLRRLGHSVARARDLEDARRQLSSRRYDLLLADLEAPQADSYELAELLPAGCFMVTTSGYDEAPATNTIERWLGHLCKPYPIEQLVGILERARQALGGPGAMAAQS